LLVRAGASMWQLALVLFVLQRFGSPSLAGISVFLAIAPGVLVSPIAGALLDRFGRVRLMVSDYAVSAAALAGIVVLANLHAPLAPILVLVVIGSLLNPLRALGPRRPCRPPDRGARRRRLRPAPPHAPGARGRDVGRESRSGDPHRRAAGARPGACLRRAAARGRALVAHGRERDRERAPGG